MAIDKWEIFEAEFGTEFEKIIDAFKQQFSGLGKKAPLDKNYRP